LLRTWHLVRLLASGADANGQCHHCRQAIPAGTKWIHPVGQRTNFWTPTAFPVAEGYEFTCRLDDGSAEAVAVLGVGMAERFEVGQPITIVYQHRNFGPFWQRTYVLGMQKVPA
jgi:hypothetical protein